MKRHAFARLAAIAVLAPLALSSCAVFGPVSERAFHTEGLYVGGMQMTSQVMGEMDEELIVIGVDDVGFIPDFDGETGVGFAPMIGYRWHTRALELSAQWTDYGDPEYFGAPFDAELFGISLDWKEYYNVDQNLQPFLFAGVASIEMRIEDAAASLISPDIADLELDGVAINVGGGANFYLSRNLAVFGQIYWSFIAYNEAKTVFPPEILDGRIDGDSLNIAFGASWTF